MSIVFTYISRYIPSFKISLFYNLVILKLIAKFPANPKNALTFIYTIFKLFNLLKKQIGAWNGGSPGSTPTYNWEET